MINSNFNNHTTLLCQKHNDYIFLLFVFVVSVTAYPFLVFMVREKLNLGLFSKRQCDPYRCTLQARRRHNKTDQVKR